MCAAGEEEDRSGKVIFCLSRKSTNSVHSLCVNTYANMLASLLLTTPVSQPGRLPISSWDLGRMSVCGEVSLFQSTTIILLSPTETLVGNVMLVEILQGYDH
jgi:hypothetical protein